MVNNSFINELCDSLISEHGYDGLQKIVIVIPSQRVALYIRESLQRSSTQNFWMPKIITINEFLEEQHDFTVIDDLEMIFELYEAYQSTFEQPENFDDFLSWSSMILSDFNEIDKYLLDVRQVFKNLQSIKDIESWSFGSDKLSETQKKFLGFWEKLGDLYHDFHERLGRKEEITNARVYRLLAEQPEKYLTGIKEKVYLVGFNALSRAEEKIFKFLVDAKIGEVIWDIDNYYVQDRKMEAGKFVRKYGWSGKNHRVSNDNLTKIPKEIGVFRSNSNLQQTLIASKLLADANSEKRENTALVFADETLLMPMLNVLPDGLEQLNVAMGYPLNAAAIFSLFEEIVQVQVNIERYKNKGFVYYKDFQAITQHELFQVYAKVNGIDISGLQQKITKENYSFLPLELVEKELAGNKVMFLFTKQNELTVFIDQVIGLFKSLYSSLVGNLLEQESINALILALMKIAEIQTTYNHISRITTLNQLSKQVLRGLKVSFLGEPLSGIQFLGLLETRALDFEHVILMSCNEDILPKQQHSNSLIPYDLRVYLGLPVKDDKEAIFAYYFYRLIQRASKIDLIYNGGEIDGLSSNEISRYILQLREELKGSNISIVDFDVQPNTNSKKESIEEVSPELIRNRIFEWMSNGISASGINSFHNCPKDFLYTQLLRFSKDEDIEEDIESSTYGTIVHEVLENLYRNAGSLIGKIQLAEMMNSFRKELDASFYKRFPSGNFKLGKNLLMYETALYTIKKFLESELVLINEYGVINILGLEEAFEKTIVIPTSFGEKSMKIKGLIDRIDLIGDRIRIVDYKTGVVDQLNFSNDWNKVSKFQLQLMVYMYLYDTDKDISCGMISFKSMSKGYQKFTIQGRDTFDAAWVKSEFATQFEAYLSEFVNSVLTSNFEHTPQSKYCTLC